MVIKGGRVAGIKRIFANLLMMGGGRAGIKNMKQPLFYDMNKPRVVL
jgi:hypothetical protein